MSMSIIGTKIKGLKIENSECIKKSFPSFLEILTSLTNTNHNHMD